MTNFFVERSGLKLIGDSTNDVLNEYKGILGCSKEENFFLKIGNFFIYFAYPGSQISWLTSD